MKRFFFAVALRAGVILTILLAISQFPVLTGAEVIKRSGPLLTVREIGTATLGEGTKAQVKGKAKAEAIRKAIEENAGVVITAQSTMKNFEMADDVVNSYARVFIKSIREISYSYDSAKETGVYRGEFVIDTSSLQGMSQAEKALQANRNKPIETSVFLFDENGQVLHEGRPIKKGDRFNVMVQPSTDLFVYIISLDSKGKLYTIFPNPKVSGHSNPLGGGEQYYFPPQESDQVFMFDDTPGKDRFYFMFSAVPMKDMDFLFEKLANADLEEQGEINSIIQERIASRGIALESKTTKAAIDIPNGRNSKRQKSVGELLKGTGAFVKTVKLRHVE